ncbi:MAG: hypothetical protein PVF05_12560 [Gemmatimonadales bacterium]
MIRPSRGRLAWSTLWAGVVLAACGGGGEETGALRADMVRDTTGSCEPPMVVGALPGPLLEASGIARDPRDPGLFWVHNDSGNPAELYAIDRHGRLREVVPTSGTTNRDLEDIAVGPCPDGTCLYVADIGDNLATYASIVVHRLPLPPLPAAAPADGATSSPETAAPIRPGVSWWFVYPGGPRDAESLAVDGTHRELIVVTKGREAVVDLYVAPLDGLRTDRERPNTLRRIGKLRIPVGGGTSQLVTAADLSPDGKRLVIRSYTTLYEFDWDGSAAFDTLATPRHTSLLAALEPQGEGVAFGDSGDTLWLVSEGRGGRPPSLSRMSCPAS